jgi:polysaccharide pyruvyl transferase WcaK-like protein
VQGNVVWRDSYWNADEAMSVYARAHSMFGIEPHSLIMGLALGVPVVHARALSHGRKGWMFRDIGLPEWLYDIDQASAGEITGAVMKIHQAYPQAKEKARKAMACVAERQKTGMQVIRRNLKLTT